MDMAEIKAETNTCSTEATPTKSLLDQDVKEDRAVLDSLQELAESSLDSLQDSTSENESKDKYVPGPFPKERKSLADIKQNLLSIISQCEAEDEDELILASMRPRKWMDSEVQKAALLSHTMAAYISTLNKSIVRRVAMQLVSDTTLWLSEIFRFPDSLAYFSKDSKEGLIRIIRKALLGKYKRYCNAGYEVLFTRPPVIYYCDMQGKGIGKHVSYLCSQLGLPLSSVTSVPCISATSDGKYKMDPAVLEKYIKDDISATKTPLVVLANAGFPLLGHIDNLQKIYEICTAHDVWLHVHGHSLAGLCLLTEPKVPSIPADSLSLCVGKWIGLPSLPYVTLYRGKDSTHIHEAGLDQAFQGHLDFLPVWVTIQTLGHETLIQRIQLCFNVGNKLLEKIENFPEMRIISKRRIVSNDSQSPESPYMPVMSLLESLTPVIVFQYTTLEAKEKDAVEPNPPYYDNLNSWLIQILSRQVPNIKTDIVDLDEYGLCLRISPLETATVLGTTEADVEEYYCCLKQQTAILSATARQREKLYTEYKNHKKLLLVDIVDWAGMGAAILSATARQREKLYTEYKNHKKLLLVDIVDWAGMGAAILSATARQREKLYTEYKNHKKLLLVDIVDWAGMGAAILSATARQREKLYTEYKNHKKLLLVDIVDWAGMGAAILSATARQREKLYTEYKNHKKLLLVDIVDWAGMGAAILSATARQREKLYTEYKNHKKLLLVDIVDWAGMGAAILSATARQREKLYTEYKNHKKLLLVDIVDWAGMGAAILSATARQREKLYTEYKNHKKLLLVDIVDWAGMGAAILSATARQREKLYTEYKNHKKLLLVDIVDWAGMGAAILSATARQREKLYTEYKNHKKLLLVDIVDWAGMGAAILSATARQREKLYTEYKNHKKLLLVDIVDWAGMGAVRYIPEFWVDRLNELTDTGKADINHLNTEIVAKLKASDSAFSVGETEDGMICVRFGMVDDNLDLEELIGLVIAAGEELEESSKFLETMSEMIKHGIEEANKELIQENHEKFMQEGILRQVPVLGSLVSWWYPTQSEPGIKGRSFNLSSGTIESTENIYKYHMQLKEGSKSPSTTAKVLVAANSSQASVPPDQNSNTAANR